MPPSPAIASILKMLPSMPRSSETLAPGPPGPASPPVGLAGPPGGPGGPGGGAADFAAIAKDISQSSVGDPNYVLNILRNIKMQLAQLIPHVAFRMSDVDKHLNPAYRSIDNALTAAEKSAQQIAAQKPIDFSAANSGPGMAPPPSVGI